MITLKIDNQVSLYPASSLPRSVAAQIRSRLCFLNPAYQQASKRGFWTGNLEREIKGYRTEGDSLIIRRGFTRQLTVLLHQAGVKFKIEDRRRVLPAVDFTFDGKMRDYQETAVREMDSRNFGVLAVATGSGKTVVNLITVNRGKEIPPKPDFYS